MTLVAELAPLSLVVVIPVVGPAPLSPVAVVPELRADVVPAAPAAVVAPATSLGGLCFLALLSVVVTPVVGPAPLRPVVMIPVVGPAPLSPVAVVPELRADDVPAVHAAVVILAAFSGRVVLACASLVFPKPRCAPPSSDDSGRLPRWQ